MAKMIKQEFQVSGSFSFPCDMLRYDSCFPADEQQSALIQNTFDAPHKAITVRLARYTRRDMAPITPERWKSFGWHVVPRSVQEQPI
jgi:hypothetical protein